MKKKSGGPASGSPEAKAVLGDAWLAERRRRTAPSRRSAFPPYGWVFVAAGAVLIFGGVLHGLCTGFAGPPEAAATGRDGAAVTPKTAAALGQRDVAQCEERVRMLGRRSLPPPDSGPVDHRVERERRLQWLEVDGNRPKFFPVSELKLPPGGKPVQVFCLLTAPLDSFTEDSWRQNGLFDCADEMGIPYIRLVQIAGDRAFECLNDYRVEGVAYDLAPVPPE